MAQCDVQALLSSASCFSCLSPGVQQMLELQLLCEVLAVTGGGSGGGPIRQVYQSNGDPNGVILVNTTYTCYCIDTLNDVAWIKTDGIISSTGWVLV